MTYVTRAVGKAEQRELCLKCTLEECKPESRLCMIRRRVNELLRIRYWKNVDRSRASRRKSAIPPEQYEKKRQYMKTYYQDCREVVLFKMRQKAA